MTIEKPNDKHCDFNSFKRARYFHGMLMSDRDFKDEQKYHIEKRKRLNRMLHGWGVVCGLGLGIENCKPSTVIIEKGMALDCNGNEIFVDAPYELDVEEAIKSHTMHGAQLTDEKMCEKTDLPQAGPDRPDKWYVVIKYREVPTDPVPVYAPGGGCEEKVCEHSRTREGFCIELHKEKPYQPRQKIDSLAEKIYDNCREEKTEPGRVIKVDFNEKCMKEKLEEFMPGFCDSTLDCPSCCPCEHYVILGTVVVGTENNKKTYSVDSNEGRQYVFTPHLFKYLFRVLFEGAGKILKDLVPELCESGIPDVNLLHENPIKALCWLGKLLSPLIKEKEETEPNPGAVLIDMELEPAIGFLVEEGYVIIGEPITETPQNRPHLIEQSYQIAQLGKGAAVHIVVNNNEEPSYFIPSQFYAAAASFKEDMEGNRKELKANKTELEKQVKAVDEKYKKDIDNLKKELKNLKRTT